MPGSAKANGRASSIVGRAAEVGYLKQCLEAALRGERQVVFVTGEPGIGKTTVVDTFLEQVRDRADLRIGRGQCIEQYGQGEAFLPLLEIGTRFCQAPGNEQVVTLLRQYAPTWLVQLPGVLPEAEWEQLSRRVQGSTRERMLREAAEAIVHFTREQGCVLVLEDLHWSDVSTLEWLSYVAQRREPAKLLVIGTYRPTDVLSSGHPLRGVVQELTARGRCEELRVTPLTESAVGEYLHVQFDSAPVPPALPGLIRRRTGGNPLFMVAMVAYLRDQGAFREAGGQWDLQQDLRAIAGGVPDSLRHLIERQLERLPEEGQRLLEVASVVGVEFSSAAVAAGLQVEVEAVEEQCDELVRKGQFIGARGTEEWPDGTLSERYSFFHALYRDVLYGRLAETRRVRLHRRIGERKAAAYGQRAGEVAGELAVHFEAGRDPQKAAQYHEQAGETARRRHAYHEAIEHFTNGLALLQTLPDTPERTEREIQLYLSYATTLMVTQGLATPEVEQAYSRAWELCQQLGDTPLIFPVLKGLWVLHDTRAENERARELAEQFLSLAHRASDPISLSQAYSALGWTLFKLGNFASARTYLEQGITCYPPLHRSVPAFTYGRDTGMTCLSFAALDLWFLGYPDQALQRSREALALARELSHPYSEAFALCLAAALHHYRGEGRTVRAQVEAVATLSTEYRFPTWSAAGAIMDGWSVVEQGRVAEGIAQLRQGIATWRALGAKEFTPYWLALLAEAYGKNGQPDEGLAQLATALTLVDKTEERFYEAELYRLKGELTLQSQSSPGQVTTSQGESEITNRQAPTPNPQAEAEVCFHKALEIACQQQAKALELRAALSLCRLWRRQGKEAEARTLLEGIYSWFTEGFDTKDSQEAEALLRDLGSTVERTARSSAPALQTPIRSRSSLRSFSSQGDTFLPSRATSGQAQTVASSLIGDTDAQAATVDQVFRPKGSTGPWPLPVRCAASVIPAACVT